MKKPSKLPDEESLMTFWDHVEVLRKVIFSCLIPLLLCTVAAFLFKDTVFEAVMAPSRSDFILYRGLSHLAALTGITSLAPPDFEIQLINTQLVSQFMVHLRISLYVGIVVAAPYIIYRLFGFVAPALYEREKRYAVAFIASAALLFVCGALLAYFLIFPLSFRFLGTYQVAASVVNQINLDSYISTFLMLILLMGILFEIPILTFFLAKWGIMSAQDMKRYRRHAFVVICIVAAIITPTVDIFTLLLVACPIALLYELGIVIARHASPASDDTDTE